MDKETLLKEHPELAEAFRAEGRAEGMKAGAESERGRIQGVLALGKKVTGCNDIIDQMAFDGQTSPEQASGKLIDAIAEKKGQIAAKVVTEAAKPVSASHSEGGDSKPVMTGAEYAAKIQSVIAEHAAKGHTITYQQALVIAKKG